MKAEARKKAEGSFGVKKNTERVISYIASIINNSSSY
jgi:hypothetical protein